VKLAARPFDNGRELRINLPEFRDGDLAMALLDSETKSRGWYRDDLRGAAHFPADVTLAAMKLTRPAF
jgi:hypothetical protein